MRRSRISEKQIIGSLKEHQAGPSAKEPCRRHGVSEPTCHKWRSKHGGLEGEPLPAIGPATVASEGKRPRALEEEAAPLEKLLPKSMVGVSTLREMLGKNIRG